MFLVVICLADRHCMVVQDQVAWLSSTFQSCCYIELPNTGDDWISQTTVVFFSVFSNNC